MTELDQIDRNIIYQLRTNAKMTMTTLAEAVGLSKTPVIQRVKRLEAAGVIRGYTAIVDHNRLGLDHVAFVQVRLSDTRSPALLAFNKAVNAVSEIEQCHMTAAGFDYLLKVRTRDIGHYRKVLGETISSLPHVANTSTFVVMETVKEG